MADPIVNFFKSTLVGTYSDADNSITIATGDGALLPDPSTDGAFNLTIFEGLQVTNSTEFEIVRVTARSGDVLTVTRGAESTTPLTIGSAVHSILMSATKKTFDDINDAIDNVDLTTLTGVEELTFDSTGDEEFGLPAGTTAQRPASPSVGYMRWNSTLSRVEVYNGTRWAGLSEIGLEQVSLGVAQLSVTANDAGFQSLVQQVRGTISGYQAGGNSRTSGDLNVIQKYSFTADQNATDVGNLTSARETLAGTASATHGYVSGGFDTGNNPLNIIEKTPFASDSNSTDVGDMTIYRRGLGGNMSASHGYNAGGGNYSNVIDKFPFATDNNSTDVGDLTVARTFVGSTTSATHGYSVGGFNGNHRNFIDKFSLSSDGNATDVGDDVHNGSSPACGQSETHGYIMGGNNPYPTNKIRKISFASDGNAQDIADLGSARESVGPNAPSSTTHAYQGGGNPQSGNTYNVIEKTSFASDSNATDVGDLFVDTAGSAGFQA